MRRRRTPHRASVRDAVRSSAQEASWWLSFAFLEAAPYRRGAVRSTRSYRQVSRETEIPLETLRAVLESMGSPGQHPMSRCARPVGAAGGLSGLNA